jgi:hypothetical protein
MRKQNLLCFQLGKLLPKHATRTVLGMPLYSEHIICDRQSYPFDRDNTLEPNDFELYGIRKVTELEHMTFSSSSVEEREILSPEVVHGLNNNC